MLYKSLQAGRAFAAILVVLFHLGETIALDKYFGIAAFKVPFSFGASGVEFFFVLSGFIILAAHQRDIFKPNQVLSYIRKRVIRIYPVYWIVFLGVYLAAIASPTLRNTVPGDIFVVAKSLLLIPQGKSALATTGAPVLSVAWTLQYEVLFYALFSCLVLGRVAAGLAVSALACIYVLYSGGRGDFFPVSFLMQDYMWLFAMGMGTYLASISRKVTVNKPMFYACAGIVLFGLVALDTVFEVGILKVEKTILYGVASSLIIFGLTRSEIGGDLVMGNDVVQLLGASSYSLYLIHFPLISVLCKAALVFQLNKLGLSGALISYFGIFLICLISAVAFHVWVEKPISSILSRH